MLIKIQPDATVCRYLLTAKSLYMFRVSQHPSSGVLKTVTATSVTGHNTGTATSLQRGLISDFAVNKYLHTVASGWIFISTDVAQCFYLLTVVAECFGRNYWPYSGSSNFFRHV